MNWEEMKRKVAKARKDGLKHTSSALAQTLHLIHHNERSRDAELAVRNAAKEREQSLEPAVTADEFEEQKRTGIGRKKAHFRRAMHERVEGPFQRVSANGRVTEYTIHSYLHATKGWRSRTIPC